MRQHRGGRVAVAAVDEHAYPVGGEHLERADHAPARRGRACRGPGRAARSMPGRARYSQMAWLIASTWSSLKPSAAATSRGARRCRTRPAVRRSPGRGARCSRPPPAARRRPGRSAAPAARRAGGPGPVPCLRWRLGPLVQTDMSGVTPAEPVCPDSTASCSRPAQADSPRRPGTLGPVTARPAHDRGSPGGPRGGAVRVLAFDLDDTLAVSKSQIDPRMAGCSRGCWTGSRSASSPAAGSSSSRPRC